MTSYRQARPAPCTPPRDTDTRQILIVDDEPKIRAFVGRALIGERYAADFACNGADGLRQALMRSYDLVILDLVMPDMDGQVVLEQLLRARPEQAVLVLSCVSDVASKVDCLEHGAQDYLTKPFSLAELLARVHVRLREDGSGGPAGIVRTGVLSLDMGHLTADIGNGPVPLTRLEFLVLKELAARAGLSVPKGELLAKVWGYDFNPGSNVVDVCIRRLRAKLGFGLIKTVRGEGYELVAE
jgi:two-component system, OmpR family, response regulator